MMTIKRMDHIQLSHILTVFVLLSVCTKQLMHGYGYAAAAAGPGRCIDDEKLALLDFKSSLVDDYGRLSTWNDTTQADCCRWSGVSCNNRTGNVVRLDLRALYDGDNYRPLTGNVNPSLLQLPYLNHLDLSGNNFGLKPIPKFIGSLANLTYLNLSTAKFAGTVPNQLGNLTDLRYLSLSYSASDAENLDWLSGLTLLEHLDMDQVNLSKVDDWEGTVAGLPSLSYLSLSGCQLPDSSLPNSSSSTSIRTLNLSYNNITSSVFHWLFGISRNLVDLSLSFNQLKGPIPEAFGRITSLERLLLSDNLLSGNIPDSFGDLVSLTHFDLSNNLLSGNIPKSLGNLCKLITLYLRNNLLTGDLHDFIDQLSRCPEVMIENLDVNTNRLTGTVPDSIGGLLSLKTLSVSNNKLNGSLTENLGKLIKLTDLTISNNSLQGIVSEAHFANLSRLSYLKASYNHLSLKFGSRWVPPFQLEYIYLRSCNLGPSFPGWIQTQKNFYILDISDAGITDTIPARFWEGINSTRLRSLNLSSNQFKGTVPDLASKMTIFSTIDLSSNLFEGSIPGIPPILFSLDLSRNKFSGSISSLCQTVDVSFLTHLDLSHNLLTGGLPDSFSTFEQLKVFNLAHNNLSGTVPVSFGSLIQLEVLNLYNNGFYGELPVAITNWTKLNILNLGSNKLSGVVPEWIGANLFKLNILSLRSNNFSGTIPSRICQLSELSFIDLSMNRLSGKIPKCLNNLTSMAQKGRRVQVKDHPYMDVYEVPSYIDNAIVGWQGREVEFRKNLGMLKSIDLSSNDLSGEIPEGITDLFGLITMNLSRNQLNGGVPQGIGRLTSVIMLDLSRNMLSGDIPASMSRLSLLGYLDLSHNNLSGRIPSSTQLQSFNDSTYVGNAGLCGPPLTKPCPRDELLTNTTGMDGHTEQEDKDVFWRWFGSGAFSGFAAGFCGACGILLINHRWGDAVFIFLKGLMDVIIIKVTLLISEVKELIRMKV